MSQINILEKNGSIKSVEESSQEGLNALRLSVALLLAAALNKSFAGIRLGEIVADENGFYVDSDKDESQVSADELEDLESKINDFIENNVELKPISVALSDALAAAQKDKFQQELLQDAAENNQVSMFQIGDFKALADGKVLADLANVKNFKLLSVAGAYWKSMSSNPMLQRIYGSAFFNAEDLQNDLKARKEARERDHRVIGNDLDLFFVDPKVGAGLPYWMPKGSTIRRVIERYIIDKEVANGYKHVYTPVLMNLDVYKTSGHWQHYREDMFPPMDMGDGEQLELRPMNCPSHIQIYNHHIRSYRELPLRIAELGMMHRYEKSGALSGLQRVREMTLNDGHTFVAPDQILDEFKSILKLMIEVYHDFNIDDYSFRLSYRDPENTDKYFDDDEMWNSAQTMLKQAMDDMGLDYYEAEGEAAFYGPKLDVQTKTAAGNDETLSTIQLDFMLPKQFDLHYVGEDGEQHRPIMIHRGLVSTMERFTAYLTEMYKGAFPTWLSPIQVKIIPVKEELHAQYADQLNKELSAAGIRVSVDHRNEKMGYKIREAQTQKVPYTLVVGDNEVADKLVSVRKYGEEQQATESKQDFLEAILSDLASYSRE
ncbi:threonine--tRNA ligase [Paucilactobacillus sp. N302-9]